MIYTWIGAPGWNPALGWVEYGLEFAEENLPIDAVAACGTNLVALGARRKAGPDPDEPSHAVATAPTGEPKE